MNTFRKMLVFLGLTLAADAQTVTGSLSLPPANSLGIGNTPPTLTYGPGFLNWDLSLYKEFSLGRERTRALQFRMETFNTFNHFNPGNPNTSLTYNFQTGAQTNANFGAITTAQNPSRRMVLSNAGPFLTGAPAPESGRSGGSDQPDGIRGHCLCKMLFAERFL